MKKANDTQGISIAILAALCGLMFVLYALIGVSWFKPGDFSFPTAMAYHGILIPAWIMIKKEPSL